jgi:hypothetical protein
MPEHLKKLKVPPPPHPNHRRKPLPEQRPKSIEEHPEAQERIKTTLESAGYPQADEDVDFLNRYDLHGVRLQIDYLKAELLLKQHSIRHTIVVFGRTRIREPAAVQRQVEALRAAQAADPANTDVARRLEIAQRLLPRAIIMMWLASSGASSEIAGRGPTGPIW